MVVWQACTLNRSSQHCIFVTAQDYKGRQQLFFYKVCVCVAPLPFYIMCSVSQLVVNLSDWSVEIYKYYMHVYEQCECSICTTFLPLTLPAIFHFAQIRCFTSFHWLVLLCAQIIGRDCIIDIHKWDYLARNSRGLNVSCGLDPSLFHRFLQCVQVDKDQEVLMIRDKVRRFIAIYYAVSILYVTGEVYSSTQIYVQCTLRDRCCIEELVSTRQSLQ